VHADTGGSSAADPSAWSSNGASRASAPPSTSPPPPTRFDLVDRLAALRKAVPRMRSQHLAGEHEAEILANDEAAAYPTLGPSRSLGAGAVLLEALYLPEQKDAAMYFAMIKQPAGAPSAWEYLVVEPGGRIQQRGLLTLCERCHTEAPHDHVFGRPR
jgi:hypothetical protein